MEEKIYNCFITNELADRLIQNYHENGDKIHTKDSNLISELIKFDYMTNSEIKIVDINMIHDVTDEFNNSNYLDKEEKGFNKTFVLFLNKPEENGNLIIKNTKYGKTSIDCERNKLVIFPEEYGFCINPSIKYNYLIYGSIHIKNSMN